MALRPLRCWSDALQRYKATRRPDALALNKLLSSFRKPGDWVDILGKTWENRKKTTIKSH